MPFTVISKPEIGEFHLMTRGGECTACKFLAPDGSIHDVPLELLTEEFLGLPTWQAMVAALK